MIEIIDAEMCSISQTDKGRVYRLVNNCSDHAYAIYPGGMSMEDFEDECWFALRRKYGRHARLDYIELTDYPYETIYQAIAGEYADTDDGKWHEVNPDYPVWETEETDDIDKLISEVRVFCDAHPYKGGESFIGIEIMEDGCTIIYLDTRDLASGKQTLDGFEHELRNDTPEMA